jgi:hypothetical protein
MVSDVASALVSVEVDVVGGASSMVVPVIASVCFLSVNLSLERWRLDCLPAALPLQSDSTESLERSISLACYPTAQCWSFDGRAC